MEITIKVQGLEGLAEAILKLAGVIGENQMGTKVENPINQVANATAVPQQIPVQQPVQTPQMPQATVPMQAPVPQTPMTPPVAVPITAAPASTVPTTAVAQEYTQDQLAVAMTGLVDQGKQPVLMQILSEFGAQSLMQVQKAQYPTLVLRLREAGANI